MSTLNHGDKNADKCGEDDACWEAAFAKMTADSATAFDARMEEIAARCKEDDVCWDAAYAKMDAEEAAA